MEVLDQFRLDGRVALVTGGSRGLGLEMAQALGEAGAAVAVTARREQWLQPAVRQLTQRGIRAAAFPGDVSEPDSAQRLVEQTEATLGPVDLLVNNAGTTWGAPAEEMPLERWESVLRVNLTGSFLMAQAVLPGMRERGGGSIINVASVAGLMGVVPEILDTVGYSAAKGGLVALTRDLAVKWARYGIRVNAIAPGFFPTRMTEKLLARVEEQLRDAIPLQRIGAPGEIRGVCLFLASPAASYVTGQVIAVDGGMSAA